MALATGAQSAASIEALEVVATEGRPFEGRSSIGAGFLALIPFVPYGRQQISPEMGGFATSLKHGDFPSDVADVVIKDLRAMSLAHWVGSPEDRLPGPEAKVPPYRLNLTVKEGIYHRNLTLYGMSFLGAFFWMVGAPSSYGSAELAIEAELMDPDGASLGTQSFHAKASAVEWLYYSAVPAYTSKMLDAYAEISPQLRHFVAERLSSSAQ